jgi:outer membrane protein TolC
MTPLARAAAGLALLTAGFAGAPAVVPAAAHAQQPVPPAAAGGPLALSLDDALRLAERQSESVRIAQTGVGRARGQVYQARAQGLPQINASASYQRAIQNQFNELSKRAARASAADTTTVLPPLCAPNIPPGASPADRAAALAAAQTCVAGDGGLGGFAAAFASPNTIVLGLSGSQPLYTGGRVTAARRSAEAGRRSADIGVTGARTQVRLDVATAYFDAALADRLVTIAESSLVQTERAYRQTALAREVGNVSEFDLLRARVTRDNQRPQLVQARGTRETAYLRLRQLLVLPLDAPLRLTTALPLAAGADTAAVGAASRAPLDAAGLGPARPGAPQRRPAPRRDSVATTVNARGDTARVRTVTVDPAEVLGDDPRVRRAVDSAVAASDTSGRGRLTFRQSSENVSVQRNLLRVARAQRVPALQLSGNYQRFAYPQGDGIVFPNSFGQFIPNFTVTLGVSVPVFTGGRIRGDILAAQANLREAEATARQVEQLSSLDARLAITQFEQAEAGFAASAGTAEQAARAFGIAEVRFREGVATSVELADARLLLQQAQANAAQAARDREVARLRLTLLRDLPLSQVQGGAQAGAGGFGGRQGGGAGQQAYPISRAGASPAERPAAPRTRAAPPVGSQAAAPVPAARALSPAAPEARNDRHRARPVRSARSGRPDHDPTPSARADLAHDSTARRPAPRRAHRSRRPRRRGHARRRRVRRVRRRRRRGRRRAGRQHGRQRGRRAGRRSGGGGAGPRRPRERGGRRARPDLERPRAQRLAHPRALGDAARPGERHHHGRLRRGRAGRAPRPAARPGRTTGIAEQAVSARAGVAAARNSFELAARNADRAERLLAAGAIASRDAEAGALGGHRRPRSQLSTAQAQLALAQRSSATPPPPRRSPASSARAR